MPVYSIIFIWMIFNFCWWLYLLFRLKRTGKSLSQSLKLAWSGIVGFQQPSLDCEYPGFSMVSLLQKSWWISILIFSMDVLHSNNKINLKIFIGIFVFHILWYWLSLIPVKTKFDKTLPIHAEWGVFFQEIYKNSVLLHKSLAELDLRKKNLLVLSIERNGQVIPFPKGLEIIQVGDRLVIFGEIISYRAILD